MIGLRYARRSATRPLNRAGATGAGAFTQAFGVDDLDASNLMLLIVGEVARAKAVFSRALAFANDVGLLAEEVDPATRELLGNFPPASYCWREEDYRSRKGK